MTGKKWSDEDINLLRALRPTTLDDEISKMIGKNVNTIRCMSYALSIKKEIKYQPDHGTKSINGLSNKKCANCGNTFKPKSGANIFCEECLDNVDFVKSNKRKYCNNHNAKRKEKRALVNDMWGRKGRETWKEAELISLDIIETEGFNKVESLTDIYPHGFFDIKAIDTNGEICLFQVTTRTHTHIKKPRMFANKLGIYNIYIIFISFEPLKYIIKKVHDGCDNYELSIKEVLNI